MAEKETKNNPKQLIEVTPEALETLKVEETLVSETPVVPEPTSNWKPKTALGKEVKEKKITNIDDILSSGKIILEPEIVDSLLPLESDLLLVGQAKGKFGGGKRRAWRQTQRKTMEGNVVSFSTMAVVGDKNGHIGIGMGKGKETLPAREKAIRRAKLEVRKIERGCGHFDCSCTENHSIPFIVEGKCGSVRVKLMPAPQGTGLVVGDELKKMLRLAGIKDVYAIATGQTRTTFNAAKACFYALLKTGGSRRK
jgi:small subunit ribosomal protein S5